MHFYIFEDTSDVIPAILAIQESLPRNFRMTVIRRSDEDSESLHSKKRHLKKLSKSINEKVIDKAIEMIGGDRFQVIQHTEVTTQTRVILSQPGEPISYADSEFRIFFGETVDCGIISTLNTKAVRSHSSALADLHSTSLRLIISHIDPDLIISENHTFEDKESDNPVPIKAQIESILSGSRQKKHTLYQLVDHHQYTLEDRKRFYMIASPVALSAQVILSELNGFDGKHHFFLNDRSYSHLSNELRQNQVTTELLEKTDQFKLPSESDQFVSDVLKNYAAAAELGFIQVVKGIMTIKDPWTNALYVAKIAPGNPIVSGRRDGVISFDTSGALKVSSSDKFVLGQNFFDLRFNLLSEQPRILTIAGSSLNGFNFWGSESEKILRLDPYTLARFHGASPLYAQIILDAFANEKTGNVNNNIEYLGHSLSSHVVSRILYVVLEQLGVVMTTPAQDGLVRDQRLAAQARSGNGRDSKKLIEMNTLDQLRAHYVKDSMFLFSDDRQFAYLVHPFDFKKITPSIYWTRFSDREENVGIRYKFDGKNKVPCENARELKAVPEDLQVGDSLQHDTASEACKPVRRRAFQWEFDLEHEWDFDLTEEEMLSEQW